MAELVVKYRLDADGLRVRDLIAERDFLALQLGIPDHLLQVLSWGEGSLVIKYRIVRDLLPLVELTLCGENVQAELTQHGVKEVYLGSHPSEHPSPVRPRGEDPRLVQYISWLPPFPLHCRWSNLCRLNIVRKTEYFSFMNDVYIVGLV